MPTHQALLTHDPRTRGGRPLSDSPARGEHPLSDSPARDEHPPDDFSCPAAFAVRLLAVPDAAPPFDGDLPADRTAAPEPRGRRGACPDDAADAGRGPDTGLDSNAGRNPDAGPGPDAGRNGGTTSKAQGSPGRVELMADGDWPERFARLLTETLAGSRPARQILPCITERARIQLRQLIPVFSSGQQPRVLRVITTRPAWDAVEMTVIARLGPRTRALAVRMEKTARPELVAWQLPPAGGGIAAGMPRARWLCTDIEAA
jgi:hypothetical protein